VKFTKCLAEKAGTGECSKRIGGARFCKKHSNQYFKGIIDENGKKLRDFNKPGMVSKYYSCLAKNAGTGKCNERKNGRFCKKHSSQYYEGIIDENGKKIREKKQPENPIKCAVPECNEMGYWRLGYCRKHFLDIIQCENFDRYSHLTNPPTDIQMEEVELKWWEDSLIKE
jgi:hypothetical protein